MQWRTFPSVSVHRPIKITKDRLSQLPSGPWSDKNTVLVVSCPTVFTVQRTSLLLFTHQIQAWGQRKRQMTGASGPQGHHVLAINSARSKRFVIPPSSETIVRKLFKDWLLVTWTSKFSCFVHNHDFVFRKSLVSHCFYIVRIPCPVIIWSPGHFVLWSAKKCATLVRCVRDYCQETESQQKELPFVPMPVSC